MSRAAHRMTDPDRFLEVRSVGVLAVARAFGVDVQGRAFACPVCGAEKRHPSRSDHRGAVGARPDDKGWRCHECDAHGDAVTLAAWLATGKPDLTGEAGAAVLRACAERGLCTPLNDGRKAAPPPPRVQPAPPPPPKEYAADAAAFYGRCTSVYDDVPLHRDLRARGIDPAIVNDRDLARSLPGHVTAPWARFDDRPWAELGNRLIVPMYDGSGALVTVHARRIVGESDTPKGLSPAGCTHAGAVFADPGARLLLLGQSVAFSEIIIAEGVPDFLTWSTHYGDSENTPIIIGVISGSWSPKIAERIPTGARVVIRTHHDDGGDKYAAAIAATLGRCNLFRSVPDGDPGVA